MPMGNEGILIRGTVGCFRVKLRVTDHRKPGLIASIGPFTEQEIPDMANPAVTLTDSQKYSVGPFTAVDKKGNPVGAATGVTGASGDAAILSVVDNSDGTFSVVAVGALGQAQATFSDPSGATLVIDNTVIAGAEAGLTATIGAPVEQ